jgi:hypothetical protein
VTRETKAQREIREERDRAFEVLRNLIRDLRREDWLLSREVRDWWSEYGDGAACAGDGLD